MDKLTGLDALRMRPAMFVGDTTVRGLHHLFNELLDNSIDQFLAKRVTAVTATVSGSTLEFADDGPGLPFDEPGFQSNSLAGDYLTHYRRGSPTADGHTPHVHVGGVGCGLRIVTALTESCEVTSLRNGLGWRQTFSRGVPDGPPQIVAQPGKRGTTFRLAVDRDLFSADWSQKVVDQQLMDAAYLFPGLRVESPNIGFSAPRGLAELAAKIADETGAADADRVWWFDESADELQIQAAIAGTADTTDWRAFANGCTSLEKGTHLTALKRVVAACKIKPAVALIHVIMHNPRFAGPTRTNLDVPEIIAPVVDALTPSLRAFVSGW